MQCELQFTKGELKGKCLQLAPGEVVVLGRSPYCTIPLDDPLLSRRHCTIQRRDDQILLFDLNSTNGTFVNGERVNRKLLREQDKVRLGRSQLSLRLFQTDAEADRQATETCEKCGITLSAAEKRSTWGKSYYCIACGLKDAKERPPAEISGVEFKRKLGDGKLGPVFEGHLQSMNRAVAVKFLLAPSFKSKSDVERFHREIEAASQLNHPAIAAIHGAGDSAGFHYVISELVDGESLELVVRHGPRPSVMEAVAIAAEVTSALAVAYKKGITHRDLKPSNIIITRERRPKIIDFGLAGGLTREVSVTPRDGDYLGSVYYLPPEYLDTISGPDQRSDIYAVGASLYYMLTGLPPLEGKTLKGFFDRLKRTVPDAPSSRRAGIPDYLDRVVMRCLEKDPEARYKTPSELLKALKGVVETLRLDEL